MKLVVAKRLQTARKCYVKTNAVRPYYCIGNPEVEGVRG
ncbi:hypothetical protein CKA32_004711 [Geitlerinema sp. FC II]|nr:hypothetical protein CKA32_004711 [Geitlerinema sp. FC II]